VEALADAAKSLRVFSAMLEQVSAVAPPRSAIAVRAAAGDLRSRDPGAFSIETPDPAGESWFESYGTRARGSRMALRTARQVMALQQGSLDLTLHSPDVGELVAAFAPVGAAGVSASAGGARPAAVSRENPAVTGRRQSPTRILIVEDSTEVRSSTARRWRHSVTR